MADNDVAIQEKSSSGKNAEKPTEELTFHPAAELFPPMEGEDFDKFLEDIKKYGLRDPIITYQNKVLDGRNRYRACKQLDIEPKCEEWDGQGSVVSFIVSKNLTRRHLDESQRAMIGARILDMFKEEAEARMKAGKAPKANLPKGASRDQAAKVMNVSSRSISSAKNVLKNGSPSMKEAVDKGTVSVSTADKLSGLPKSKQDEIVASGPSAVKKAAKELKKNKKAQPIAENNESQSASAEQHLTILQNDQPSVVADKLVNLFGTERLEKICEAVKKLLKDRTAQEAPTSAVAPTNQKVK